MADSSSNSTATVSQTIKIQEESLERMEALLKQAAQGVHVLFENATIAEVMSKVVDQKDFFNLQKMQRVQEQMTELINKKSYFEKVSFLDQIKGADNEAFEMLIRTYFHIVENTARSETTLNH